MTTTLLDIAGTGCLVGAACWIYPPAGLVVLGLAFLVASVNLTSGKRAAE